MPGGRPYQDKRYPYIYEARVEQSIDPRKAGYFAARFRQGQDVPTEGLMWVAYASPLAGGGVADGAGFYMPPEPGDVVYVAFSNGDPTAPVFMGCRFSVDDSGENSIPTEARDAFQWPRNRIIKTKGGHRLELDDRDKDNAGSNVSGARLSTAGGRAIILSDGEGRTRIVDGPSGNAIELMADGVRIVTGSGAGLFVSDNPAQSGVMILGAQSDDIGLMMTPGAMQIGAKDALIARSQNVTITGDSAVSIASQGSGVLDFGGSLQMGASDSVGIDSYQINVSCGENMTFSFTQSGNFIVDMPVAGIPLESGNIMMSTMLGSITFRVGPNVPAGASPLGFSPSTPDFGDPSPATLSRITLGGASGMNVAVEGKMGGMFISGIPIKIPGLNQVLTPIRTFTTPLSPPVPTQPAVLGTNLNVWLATLLAGFSVYFKALTAASPKWGTNGGGILALAPDVIAAIAAVQVVVDKQLTALATPDPLGFLSSVVYLD